MKNQKLKKLLADKLVKSPSDEFTVLSHEELYVLQGNGCQQNECGNFQDKGSGCGINGCKTYSAS